MHGRWGTSQDLGILLRLTEYGPTRASSSISFSARAHGESSYSSCDVGTFPNQTYADGSGPAAALQSDASLPEYNNSLSWLPGQRLSYVHPTLIPGRVTAAFTDRSSSIGHARVREKTIQAHLQASGAGRPKSTFSGWSMPRVLLGLVKWSPSQHRLHPSRTIISIKTTRRTSGISIRQTLRHRIVISTSFSF